MTTDIKPLPERFDCTNGNTPWCQGCYTMTPNEYGDYVQWEDYERMTAAKDAEIERLRAEVDEWKRRGEAYFQTAEQQGKRAEQLAEALREARDMVEDWAGYASEYFQNKHDLAGDLAKLDTALRDHDQEDEK